ncbi:MAG TPA: TetR family transcriptional regulator C-terminal domain-containing protein [Tianweitania sediminis]|nr:TetR family transcriptional regulator C-terminal domain-containing protein [Tianweitania sediminis]
MLASSKRPPDGQRRDAMVEATLDCIADLGITATTVRAVAARAGVSNGLIRHHFATKENLILAAYRLTIERMLQPALGALRLPDLPAHERLARFVIACLTGPVANPRMLSIWATFISRVRVDPLIAREHQVSYVGFRRATEPLLEEVLRSEGRQPTDQEIEDLAITVHAVIDGLWLEGCLSEHMDERKQIELGLRSVEALLAIKLPTPCL